MPVFFLSFLSVLKTIAASQKPSDEIRVGVSLFMRFVLDDETSQFNNWVSDNVHDVGHKGAVIRAWGPHSVHWPAIAGV